MISSQYGHQYSIHYYYCLHLSDIVGIKQYHDGAVQPSDPWIRVYTPIHMYIHCKYISLLVCKMGINDNHSS